MVKPRSPAESEGARKEAAAVREVLKTNDPVLLDFAKVLLADAGIEAVVFDAHMSVMEGSLGILPRRLMVTDDHFLRATRLLSEAVPDQRPPQP